MTDKFHLIEEPELEFGGGNRCVDPHDGLALFGPAETIGGLPDHVVIGTSEGIELWKDWVDELNSPAACEDVARHRPWPPYPGFEVAFGARWPQPVRSYAVDANCLDVASRKPDRYERAYSVANLYLEAFQRQIPRLDSRPAIAVCVVPDAVYTNCRPHSFVPDPSENRRTPDEQKELRAVLADRKRGQLRLFDEDAQDLEQYGMSPDFRRQIKARVMEFDVPVQLVRQSTLEVTDEIRRGLPGNNPLSDRLWNMATALFYKCGRKPWKTPWAREGVCYVGIAYRRDDTVSGSACCAAQMFLDSGDGIVFVGEFGPWYSEEKHEFHLHEDAAESLLRGTIETYQAQEGKPLKEIFLHARSGLNDEEFAGFRKACPQGVEIVGIRVRQDRHGPRLFRHDNHPKVVRRGKYPVLRGLLWQRSRRHGLLFTSGFKPRIATYDGWEVPTPLSITVQHGEADLLQVASDVLGLTKLNYNSCNLGESQPITVKYSDRIGEILLANREVPRESWRHNFKYYI